MSWHDWAAMGTVFPILVLLFFALLLLGISTLARAQAQRFLRVSSRAASRWLRALSRLLDRVGDGLHERRQALHAGFALDLARRRGERWLARYAAETQAERGAFLQLKRRLGDQLERLDRDWRESAETPPEPPSWLDAIGAVARVKDCGDARVAEILDGMHATLTRAVHDAVDEYRFSSRRRHGLLRRMRPQWKKAARLLERMDANTAALLRRTVAVDTALARYERLSVRPLALRRMEEAYYGVRFVAAGAALAAMVYLGWVEHAILAGAAAAVLADPPAVPGRPAAGMVAWVIVAAQVAASVLWLELNGVTRMFPGLATLGVRARRYATVALIALWLATVGFAATIGVAGSAAAARPETGAIITGELVLLAFLLTPAALPLEAALRNGQLVLLSLVQIVVRMLAWIARAMGWMARLSGRVMIAAWEVPAAVPESIVKRLSEARRRFQAAGPRTRGEAEGESGDPGAGPR